jgi:uncharacterized protein (DUF2141 family)
LRNVKGQVVCALHASADGFPKNGDKAIAQAKSRIASGYAVCDFPDVKEGTYAIAVFHDENSNGKLDTNFMGMPSEGVKLPIMQKAISARRNATQPNSVSQAATWN